MDSNRAIALLQSAINVHSAGRLQEAAAMYRQVLQVMPKNAHALHLLGLVARDSGRPGEALPLLVESLQINPTNAWALKTLARTLVDLRRFNDAVGIYQSALSVSPQDHKLHHNLGFVLESMGRVDEAIACYQRATTLKPDFAAAFLNLGNVLFQSGKLTEALECYQRVIALNPNSYLAHNNMANVLDGLGRSAEAIDCYKRAIAVDPAAIDAYNNLGKVLNRQGKLAEALDCSRRALEINPESFDALNVLGFVLQDQAKLAEAEQAFRKAIQINPGSDVGYVNLGPVLRDLGRHEEALECYRKALAINPASSSACNNMGLSWGDLGNFEEAVSSFRQSIKLDGGNYNAYANLGTALGRIGYAQEAVAVVRKALEINPGSDVSFSNLLFSLNYLSDMDPAALFEEHLRFSRQFEEPLAQSIQPHSNSKEPERRLKIGYVCGDFRDHPTAKFLDPILVNHNKTEFEVFAYSNHPREDEITARLRQNIDCWRKIVGLTHEELADLIRKDQIDILVDLSGHTAYNSLLAFALKPAPIQISMIAYPQTTGLKAMDYRITDEILDPVGSSEHLNTEKLVRLPGGSLGFVPPAECPAVNELPALTNGYITFGSFNNLVKITPEVLAVWARILNTIPASRFLATGPQGNPLRAALEAQGVAPERIEILKRQSPSAYIALHHRVDLTLDPFPYGGNTTSMESIWMGVPFISLEGTGTRSRYGKYLLSKVGLLDFVACDKDDYVRKAVAAVGDIQRLADLRSHLRPRLEAQLGGGVVLTKEFEAALRGMWRLWCGTAY